MTEDTDIIVVEAIAYESTADLEVNDEYDIENHDELVNQGETYAVFDAHRDESEVREHLNGWDIIEPSDDEWRDAFNGMSPGDTLRRDELPAT